jgi:carbon monoxide dehydrogenase subunit G
MTDFCVIAQRHMHAPVASIWAVVDDTSRYGEWVDGVLEVTGDCGRAAVGGVYTERNRTIGPLTTNSRWTVVEREENTLRVDNGEGFAPLHEMVNTFRFHPTSPDATLMTYRVDARLGLGPLGRLVAPVIRRTLAAEFQRSMARLESVARSEAFFVDDSGRR